MNDTRLQLHWAAQIAASVGRTLLPPLPDDSHTAFIWSHDLGALVQPRSGLRLRDLTLLLLKEDGGVLESLPLTGRTLDDGFRFYETHFGRTLRRPAEGLPDHPVAHGAAFAPDSGDLARFDRLYDDASAHLEHFRATRPNSSPVRCWPHHFDIATLASLGGDHTIGTGFTPGDAQFPDPYWYVTPWPYPEDRASFAPLTSGFWNMDGWFGAVLREGEGDVSEFLDEVWERLT
jgi:hypothetical protein